jgi:diacylglycerol kinase family enzyme
MVPSDVKLSARARRALDEYRGRSIFRYPRRAARLLGTGEISSVDLGRLTRPEGPPRCFAHAATVGLNADFANLATRASIRARLGRLTYLAAAVYVMAWPRSATCYSSR